MDTQLKDFNTVWISLTYNCNNRCEWCYTASNTNEHKRKVFPIEKELPVIDLLDSLGVKRVILIGGEPTLYSDLENIVNNISQRGIRVGMVSNGRRFRERDFSRSLKANGLNYVAISVISADAGIHDKITKVNGSFNETMQGIRTASGEGIDVATNTVIGLDNYRGIERIVDLLEQEPISELTFNICGVCISQESNNSQILLSHEAVKSFERVYLYAKQKGLRTRLITPMPLCLFDQGIVHELKDKKLISGGPCQITHGKNFVIEYNGDIVPCTHLAHFPLLNIFENGGVISMEEFIRRYNNPEGVPYNFRKKVSRYPSLKCEEPNCNEYCSGGCPLFWIRFDPEIEIKGLKTLV
ncbi:MAG: radical SAM/SPASM domain-containing protein [Candidatus Pacearchaeota archaeon]